MSTEKDPARVDRVLGLIADAMSTDSAKNEAILGEEAAKLPESINKNLAFLRKIQGQTRLKLAASEREEREASDDEERQQLKDRIRRRPDPKRNLDRFLKKSTIDFRKIESMDEEDVRDIIEDIIDTLDDEQIRQELDRLDAEDT